MPIYIKVTDIKGKVTTEGNWSTAGGASGGVWKTSNFLTTDTGGSSWTPVARISLLNGVGGLDNRDVSPTRKAEQLFNTANRQGAGGGTLYVGTDNGVYARSANNRGKLIVGVDNVNLSRQPLTGQTRLIFGTDQGVFSKPGVGRLISSDSGRTWTVSAVEILVTDAGGARSGLITLQNVTISGNQPVGGNRSGESLSLNYTKIEYKNVGM